MHREYLESSPLSHNPEFVKISAVTDAYVINNTRHSFILFNSSTEEVELILHFFFYRDSLKDIL